MIKSINFVWPYGGNTVKLYISDNWSKSYIMNNKNDKHVVNVMLYPGTFEYKFVVEN